MAFRLFLILFASAAPAVAQVGYPPARSPFIDLEYRQELTGFVGAFRPSLDRARVAPRGGPLAGLRYEVRIGGPAQFVYRLARVWSERTPADPTKVVADRYLAAREQAIYLTDAGISLNLTGQKSFHRLVPVLHGGLGIATDAGTKADAGGFRFGTAFAFSFGAGVRFTPGGRLQLRADVSDWLYQIKYPPSYYTPGPDGETVVPSRQADAFWKHNGTFTIGGSYMFWR